MELCFRKQCSFCTKIQENGAGLIFRNNIGKGQSRNFLKKRVSDMKQTDFVQISDLRFKASLLIEEKKYSKDNVRTGMHSHYEVYVCLSKSVFFIVENMPYHVKQGDVLVIRPYEAHRYVCLDSEPHKFYCIEISTESSQILPALFADKSAGNLICLPDIQKESLIKLCHNISETDTTLKKTVDFFRVLELIADRGMTTDTEHVPEDVEICMKYIKDNLKAEITIPQLAEASHVTVNTLERHFKANLGMSPKEYIQNCRFVSAISIMKQGGSVQQAAEESGFADYSYFITLFKKKYGKTPNQFKKEL